MNDKKERKIQKEEWFDYDENSNRIHYKNSDGFEGRYKYDGNGNEIHYKNSDGYEYWKEYDENNNLIHYKDSNGSEYRKKYDKDGNFCALGDGLAKGKESIFEKYRKIESNLN